jgi:surfactin synthase thioesterase subunit
MRLYCIPCAGGSSTIFNKLKTDLLPNEVVAVDYKGHGLRLCEVLYRDFNDLIEDISNIIIKSGDNNYALLGHSLGSIVALEVAYKLRKLNFSPRKLILLAMRPPHLNYKNKKLDLLNKDDFMNEIYEMGNMPEEIMLNSNLYNFFYEIIYNDYKIYSEYTHNFNLKPLNIPFFIGAGSKDQNAPIEDLTEWDKYTCSCILKKEFIGDHFFPFFQHNGFEICLRNFLDCKNDKQ